MRDANSRGSEENGKDGSDRHEGEGCAEDGADDDDRRGDDQCGSDDDAGTALPTTSLWGRHAKRLGLVVLRRDATRAFEQDPADDDQDARYPRASGSKGPLTCEFAAVDAQPAHGVPDVDT